MRGVSGVLGCKLLAIGVALAGVLCNSTLHGRSKYFPQRVQIAASNTQITPGLILPKLVQYSPPPYTKEARTQRIEGTVVLQVEFDIDGGFQVVALSKRLGYGLDEAALQAIQQWSFQPAYKDGHRVTVIADVKVQFTLADDAVMQKVCQGQGGTFTSLNGLRGNSDILTIRCESADPIVKITLWQENGKLLLRGGLRPLPETNRLAEKPSEN